MQRSNSQFASNRERGIGWEGWGKGEKTDKLMAGGIEVICYAA